MWELVILGLFPLVVGLVLVLRAKRVRVEIQTLFMYVFAIAGAEVVTSFVDPSYGLIAHSGLLVSLLVLSTFQFRGTPPAKLFLSLSLAPLIRIISLSLPLAFFPRSSWYLISSIPVLVAALTFMQVHGIGRHEVGLTAKMPFIQVLLAITGIPLGIIEYFILQPEVLVAGLSGEGFLLLALTLMISTGLIEELVFRGVMQHSVLNAFGRLGLIGVTLVFALLHIGWLSLLDVVYVFLIGLLFSYFTLKTGSILGTALSHGIANVVLFLVMPTII